MTETKKPIELKGEGWCKYVMREILGVTMEEFVFCMLVVVAVVGGGWYCLQMIK